MSWDGRFNQEVKGQVFSPVIDLAFNCGCFMYIGAWMPFDTFSAANLGMTVSQLMIVLVAVMFLRRIPALLLLYHWVPEIASWKEALFAGHFGEYRSWPLLWIIWLTTVYRSSESPCQRSTLFRTRDSVARIYYCRWASAPSISRRWPSLSCPSPSRRPKVKRSY